MATVVRRTSTSFFLERDVERGGHAVGDRQSGDGRRQPPAIARVGAYDEVALGHEARDEGFVRGQQVDTVA